MARKKKKKTLIQHAPFCCSFFSPFLYSYFKNAPFSSQIKLGQQRRSRSLIHLPSPETLCIISFSFRNSQRGPLIPPATVNFRIRFQFSTKNKWQHHLQQQSLSFLVSLQSAGNSSSITDQLSVQLLSPTQRYFFFSFLEMYGCNIPSPIVFIVALFTCFDFQFTLFKI